MFLNSEAISFQSEGYQNVCMAVCFEVFATYLSAFKPFYFSFFFNLSFLNPFPTIFPNPLLHQNLHRFLISLPSSVAQFTSFFHFSFNFLLIPLKFPFFTLNSTKIFSNYVLKFPEPFFPHWEVFDCGFPSPVEVQYARNLGEVKRWVKVSSSKSLFDLHVFRPPDKIDSTHKHSPRLTSPAIKQIDYWLMIFSGMKKLKSWSGKFLLTHLKVSHHATRLERSDCREKWTQFALIHVLWQIIDDEICVSVVCIASGSASGRHRRVRSTAAEANAR